jgi:DNA-binding winged helix-turn-helix (wHTH) protein
MGDRFRFADFALDADDRRLTRDGAPVELNGRYLDALLLLVREGGRLVTKDRFMAEVWRGTPVTDEALTQCIRTLRRHLGDSAASPRFIATVPKHGYRFVAPLEPPFAAEAPRPASFSWRDLVAGTLGGGAAGLAGGGAYGLLLATGPGGLSAVLVLAAITGLVGLAGAAGVSGGVAVARRRWTGWRWAPAVGGAGGGLAIGAAVRLLGLDAFQLLLGRAPADMTGAGEGAVLGLAVGLALVLANGRVRRRAGVGIAAALGAAAGALIAAFSGRLLGGSLALLVARMPGARLGFGRVGALFGEAGFGPLTALATAAAEGALFAGGVVLAMQVSRGRR